MRMAAEDIDSGIKIYLREIGQIPLLTPREEIELAARINKTVRFAEAPVKGMSVLKYDPDGKAAFAYRQLAKEVLDGR